MKRYKLLLKYPSSPKVGTIMRDVNQDIMYSENSTDIWRNSEEIRNQPEFWEEVIEKDYEILSFKENNKPYNKIWKADTQLKDCFCIVDGKAPFHNSYKLISLGLDIHSVERLSDGEIFTVGDLCNPIGEYSNNKYKITTIEICKAGYLRIGSSNYYIGINNIEHSKKPLFTTEDGVDMFEGDEFWYVTTKGFNLWTKTCDSMSGAWAVNAKRVGDIPFSTREAAEEYILMNKPCLSLKDVSQILLKSIKCK